MTPASQRGLRLDNVARALFARLQTTLRDDVPNGNVVLFTVSAPIRLPAKTAAALSEYVRLRLTGTEMHAESGTTINGNRIRVRIVCADSAPSPNVVGFVHNPDIDATALLHRAQSALNA